MRSIRILPLLAMVPLLGCDGTGDWLPGPAAATAYAAPLASDTTVVSTRRLWSRSGPETGSTFALSMIMPNGAGLATTDWNTGDPAVFDLASKEYRRFRVNNEPYDMGIALTAAPSPDGRRIAVEWVNRRDSLNWSNVQLRLLDVTTGEWRTIMTSDTASTKSLTPVAWTPAGDSVFASLYSSYSEGGDVKVVLIPAAGGTPRPVHTIPARARPWRMSLSPDGRWLLYDHELSRGLDIDIIDVQGGGARPLVERPGLDHLVGWLPGTDVVLFSSDRSGTTDLWSVRVVDGRASAEPRRVRSGFFRSEAVGFGDGGLFYTVRTGSRGPAVINVDPQSGALLGPASPLLPNLNSAFFQLMAWSPDGQTLAAALTLERGSGTINLYSMATGESREFWLEEGVQVETLEWSADGKALFLRAGQKGSPLEAPHQFLRLDLVTGTTTRLFPEEEPGEPRGPPARFHATPDGRSIVLRQKRTLDDGRTENKLVLRSLEDGSERELYRTSGFIPEFSISADGTQLAFMQQAREDSDSLFVLRMDGSRRLRYVASWDYDVVSLLGWLPAGGALLAARLAEDGMREEILRVELDGSTTIVGVSPFRPGRGAAGVQGAYRSRLVFSPAGNRLVHTVSDTGEELWRMDGLHDLFANDATGRR